jgi:DNA-binding winged helix-turn-helix (wHTH) protein/tetratricopeptide (TPR) repeat protein
MPVVVTSGARSPEGIRKFLGNLIAAHDAKETPRTLEVGDALASPDRVPISEAARVRLDSCTGIRYEALWTVGRDAVEDPNLGTIAFPPFLLDLRAGQLVRGNVTIALRPKTFAVLSYLLERPGILVSKKELFQAIWLDLAVTEDTLTKTIGELRQALGDDARHPQLIETVHRRGFRFIGSVRSAETRDQLPGVARDPLQTLDLRQSTSIFLGRAAELRRLEDAFHRARLGERQLVFITGETGIGKTALVEAFLRSHTVRKEHDVRVAHGYSVEQSGAREAYLPVLAALGGLAGSGAPEDFVPLFRRYAPTWLVQMPWLLDPAEAAALRSSLPGGHPERMLRELAVFLERITETTSLIVVLEDLHWSDPSTAELLVMLGQSREPARLMILATYRPAEAAVREHSLLRAKQSLQLHRQCSEIALPYLSRADVDAYLAQRFPMASFPRGLGGLIHQQTDGNPLFLVAVVDQLRTRGWLVDTAPGWALTVPLETLQIEVPDDMRDMIRAQFHATSLPDQSLLEAAAVAGVEFSADEIAAALASDGDTVGAACERLVYTHRFLRVVGTAELPDDGVARRYSFIHALYQDVLYNGIPDERRGRLHRRIGEFLETAYGGARERIAAQLAHHFQQSRDYNRAISYLAYAAGTAQQRFAAREAVASLEEALALLTRVNDPEERRRREIQLRLPLGSALNLVYGYASDEVHDNYERTRALCEQAGDLSQLFEVLYALWYSQALRAEPASTLDTAERLVELAERLNGADYYMRAASALGRTALYGGDYRKAAETLGAFVDACEGSELRFPPTIYGVDPVVAARTHYAFSLHFLGHLDRARSECQKALSLAEGGGLPFTLAAAYTQAALLHLFCGDRDEALRLSDRALAVATEHGFRLWHAQATAVSGWTQVNSERTAAGIERIREAIALLTVSGTKLTKSIMLGLVAECCLRIGELEEGRVAVDEGLEHAQTTLDRSYLPELWRLKGELLLEQERLESRGSGARRGRRAKKDPRSAIGDSEAETCLERALVAARERHAKFFELRAAMSIARLWMSRGKTSEARRLLEPLYVSFTEGFDTPDLREANALLRGEQGCVHS